MSAEVLSWGSILGSMKRIRKTREYEDFSKSSQVKKTACSSITITEGAGCKSVNSSVSRQYIHSVMH